MRTQNIDDMIQYMLEHKLATIDEIEGCSLLEIEEIQAAQEVQKLPSAYIEFLTRMGKTAGRLFVGIHALYPYTMELKDRANSLLQEIGFPFELEKGDFVFLVHQGYQFLYFKTDTESNDPPVYYFCEDMDGPIENSKHFSSFLFSTIQQHILDLGLG